MDTGGASRDVGRASQGGQTISTVTAAPPALRRDGDDITDHDLVARVRAGDDRAFEALYTRYHRRIASYIQGMVHDHARAEDIAQDVFMSALRRMRETDRPIAFKPWVYEIAKNACIDQFRRARRAEEVSMDADEGLGSADYGRLVSSTPTPDVAADHKQQIDHLRGAFGGLSETHHEILVMRELEGLSYREIGDKLGMTRPAVESTLFRARRRLTEEYDQLVTGERCVRVQQIITSAGGSALGTRDRRRVARHVSYCQPCLRHARVSGLDSRDLVHKPIRQKIAALLPLPAFLRERWGTPDAHASLAQWSVQASSVDPGMVSSWGKAAATAATIALAGVSAGVATDDAKRVPGALPSVSIDSITGTDNPGSSDRFRAGSGGGVAAGEQSAAGPARRASRAAPSGTVRRSGGGDGAARGGTATTGSGGGSGDSAGSRDGSGALAGAGGTTDAGAGTTAAGEGDGSGGTGSLLSGLGGSSSSGDGDTSTSSGDSGGGGNPVEDVVSELPQIQAPASSEGSAPAPGTSPTESLGDTVDKIGDKVGEKSTDVVGAVTGG